MKKLIMAVTALALSAGMAEARGGSWSGCHVGVAGGVSVADSLNDLSGIPGIAVSVDGFAADGSVMAIGAGCDFQLDRIVIGAFGDYDFGRTEFAAAATLGAVQANITAGIRDNWTIGGRVGFLGTPDTLIYGLIGWQNAQTDDVALTTNVGFNLNLTPGDLSGMVLGGGIETRLSNAISTKIEYRFTDFDRVEMPVIAGLNLGQETELHTVRVGLNYRFNLFDRQAEPVQPLK